MKQKKTGTTKKSNNDGTENETTMKLNMVTTTINKNKNKNKNNIKRGNSTNDAKDIINTITRKWKINQSVEKQQGEKDIQKYIDKYKAAYKEIKQQYENIYKSLGTSRGWRIESAEFVRKQNSQAAQDVVEQRIQTGNHEIFDQTTNQIKIQKCHNVHNKKI